MVVYLSKMAATMVGSKPILDLKGSYIDERQLIM